MAQQRIDTTRLYGIIADMMPTEGRDFAIDIRYMDGQKPQLAVRPLTAVGRGFVPALLERLSKPMAEQGIVLASAEEVDQELMTVNVIRKHAEEESAAMIAAKLAAVRKEADTKWQAANELTRTRAAANGEDSSMGQEELAAYRSANSAKQELARLEEIAKIVPRIRANLDTEALARAKQADKAGDPQAIDMDAPLATLFDKQDAAAVMRLKESAVRRIAGMMYDMEAMKSKAAESLKHYILPKEAQ